MFSFEINFIVFTLIHNVCTKIGKKLTNFLYNETTFMVVQSKNPYAMFFHYVGTKTHHGQIKFKYKVVHHEKDLSNLKVDPLRVPK